MKYGIATVLGLVGNYVAAAVLLPGEPRVAVLRSAYRVEATARGTAPGHRIGPATAGNRRVQRRYRGQTQPTGILRCLRPADRNAACCRMKKTADYRGHDTLLLV